MDTNNLLACFSSLPETLYLRTNNGQLMHFNNGKWIPVLDKDEYLSASNHFIQSVSTSKLGGTLIYVLNSKKSIMQGNEFILFIMLLLLFLLLSIIYYFVVFSISGRIIKLKNHIGRSQAEMLMPYQTIDYRDEIGTLVTTYNEMVGDINHLLHEVYRSELQKKEANFYALQAQINPHFLYNVLENIRMSAESHQDEETAQMVYTLGKYMRYNLGKDNPRIPLIEEISHINDFLDIYKMRLKDHLHVEIFTYTEIDQLYCPKFILQPIVENSLKHGFNGSGCGTLSISVIDAPEEKSVLLQIKDDGVGIEESEFQALIKSLHSTEANISEEGEHVGLKNVYDRLVSYFNDPDIMTIESKPNQGTTVTLRLHSIQYGVQLEKLD
jgi:two-component system sensor histidine kinase YesM